MDNAARVHLLFRGAAELTKKLRKVALQSELAAAGISLLIIFVEPNDTAAWLPLGILGLMLLGSILRAYSTSANGFSQRCHRISLRAFCAGKDVDGCTAVLLEDDAPLFVERAVAKLPAKSLEEYYEPTTPPGLERQAELYAHSAFYTWNLLRLQAWVLFAGSLLVAVACMVIVYHLAAEPPQASATRKAVLEAVCTVILLVVVVKGFEAAWSAYTSFTEVRSIENALLKRPAAEAQKDLADSYDIERASGAIPMTYPYRFRRNTLSKQWKIRRQTLLNPENPPSSHSEGES